MMLKCDVSMKGPVSLLMLADGVSHIRRSSQSRFGDNDDCRVPPKPPARDVFTSTLFPPLLPLMARLNCAYA